jgi:hypothetical protein
VLRLITVLIIVFTALAEAQAPPRGVWSLPPELTPLEWEPLFNGKDLTGWVPVGDEKWTVENGGIHGEGITEKGGYLRTEQKFKDFNLSLRFKAEGDGNSGVFFRTAFDGPKMTQGLQFEIDRKPNYRTCGIYGDGRRFIVWPNAEHEMVLHPDDWNHFLLRVVRNRYTCSLNGVLLVDFTDPTPKSFDGHIALQLHSGSGGNMWFKDIYIQDRTQR